MITPPKILVVDDDASITDTLVLIFRSAGYDSLGVYSAEEARDAFVLFRPNLVLADVLLGDGNGIELAVACKRGNPDCRILLFSGHATVEDVCRIAPDSEFPLVSKPVAPQELVSLIANLFEHSSTAANA
jgi:DNA-binding NtrC family response regulator